MRLLLCGVWTGLLVLLAPASHAHEFVLVVDISGSMQWERHDPSRMAVMSSLILADLLDPVEDDLIVLPFPRLFGPAGCTSKPISLREHYAAAKKKAQALTKGTKGKRGKKAASSQPARPRRDWRQPFREEVYKALARYNGQNTRYGPCVSRAVDLLEQSKQRFAKRKPTAAPAEANKRVIILLTDGESDTRAEDLAVFEGLTARIRALGERDESGQVWVVPFGPYFANAPDQHLERFFYANQIGPPPKAVKTPQELPRALAEILADVTERGVAGPEKVTGKKPVLFEVHDAVEALDVVVVAFQEMKGRPSKVLGPGSTLVTDGGKPVSDGWAPSGDNKKILQDKKTVKRKSTQRLSYNIHKLVRPPKGRTLEVSFKRGEDKPGMKRETQVFFIKRFEYKLKLETVAQRLRGRPFVNGQAPPPNLVPLDQKICARATVTAKNGHAIPVTETEKLTVYFSLDVVDADEQYVPIYGSGQDIKHKRVPGLRDPQTGVFEWCWTVESDSNKHPMGFADTHPSAARFRAELEMNGNPMTRSSDDQGRFQVLPKLKMTPFDDLRLDAGGGRPLPTGQQGEAEVVFQKSLGHRIPADARLQVHVEHHDHPSLKSCQETPPLPVGRPGLPRCGALKGSVLKLEQLEPAPAPDAQAVNVLAYTARETREHLMNKDKSDDPPRTLPVSVVDGEGRYKVIVSVGSRPFGRPEGADRSRIDLVLGPTSPEYVPFYEPVRAEIEILVAEPGLWEKWWGLGVLLLGAIVALVLLYLIYRKPRLPPPLRYACWSGRPDQPQIPWQPIVASTSFEIRDPQAQQSTLMVLAATEDGIEVTSAPEVSLYERDEDEDGWVPVKDDGARLRLLAGHTYRLGRDGGRFLRIEMEEVR